MYLSVHCVSKNDTALACYNLDVHQLIMVIFGRNVAKKVSSQMVLYLFNTAYFLSNIPAKKLSKSVDVCRSYSKPNSVVFLVK